MLWSFEVLELVQDLVFLNFQLADEVLLALALLLAALMWALQFVDGVFEFFNLASVLLFLWLQLLEQLSIHLFKLRNCVVPLFQVKFHLFLRKRCFAATSFASVVGRKCAPIWFRFWLWLLCLNLFLRCIFWNFWRSNAHILLLHHGATFTYRRPISLLINLLIRFLNLDSFGIALDSSFDILIDALCPLLVRRHPFYFFRRLLPAGLLGSLAALISLILVGQQYTFDFLMILIFNQVIWIDLSIYVIWC